jgi:hypothetical protein
MYDIDTKNIRKSKKYYAICLIAGGIFAAIMIGIFVFSLVKQSTLDSETMSLAVEENRHTDSDGDYVYSPIYAYEVDGKPYSCTSNVSSSFKPSQESIPIYYDSKDPSRCMSDYSKNVDWFILVFLIIPAVFIAIGWIFIHKTNVRVRQVEALNQTGKLVKGLPYRLENSNIEINNRPLMKIVVDYRLPTGETITLEGDPRYDRKNEDEDGLVDLVIDESNPKNYYLDFEINRVGGNRSDDYYVNPDGTPSTPTTQSEPTPSSEPTIPPAIKI